MTLDGPFVTIQSVAQHTGSLIGCCRALPEPSVHVPDIVGAVPTSSQPGSGAAAGPAGTRVSNALMVQSCTMPRITFSLTQAHQRALHEVAARSGRSISALIRDAVEIVYGAGRSAEEDLASTREAFGAWEGRPVDGAGWAERLRSGSRLRPRDQ